MVSIYFYSFSIFSISVILFFKIKLKTIIPKPIIPAKILSIEPITGIKVINHKAIATKINIPNFMCVFSIFNLLQIILFIAITNIEVLIVSKINKVIISNKLKVEVKPKINNRIDKTTETIGVKIPNPITGKIFLVVKRFEVFSKNLGHSHKHSSQIAITVTTKVPKDKIYS